MAHDKILIAEALFRKKFLNPYFRDRFVTYQFSYNQGKTSQRIYDEIDFYLHENKLTYDRIPKWKFWQKHVRAYVKGGRQPIYLNDRILSNSIASIAGTIAHECMHLVGYGHGGNRPEGNLYFNSVPHRVGSWIKYTKFTETDYLENWV